MKMSLTEHNKTFGSRGETEMTKMINGNYSLSEATVSTEINNPDTLPDELNFEKIDVNDVVQSLQPRDKSQQKPFALDSVISTVKPGQQTPIQISACPVCEGEMAIPKFQIGKSEFTMVVCEECGLGSIHPRPASEQIRSFYPEEYYGSNGEKFVPLVERIVRLAGTRQVRQLTRGLPKGSRVLDVGCGRGTLLSSLADQGFDAYGFDISETAMKGVDPRATVRAANSLIEAQYPTGHFDLVIIWHVLEHLPNPKETLQEIRRILKPGGRLAVAVPNYSSWQARWSGPGWFHLDLPRHLFHFSSRNLQRLLEDAGFECQRERHFSIRQNPFGWVQSALNRLTPKMPNRLYALLRRSESGSLKGMSFSQRLTQRLAYWLGMPMGLALGCLAAIFRRGATVSLMAKSTKSACPVDEMIETLALASHTEPQSCETEPEVETHHQTV